MKFAKIDFIDEIEEIPFRFNLHKNEKIFNWYIKKFNPYIKEELNILGTLGYNIKLPIKKQTAYEDEELFLYLYDKTINSLKNLDVVIVKNPYELVFEDNEDIVVTNKNLLMSIFMLEIILKSVKILNKNMKDLQIVIIDEDKYLTELVINTIYENINYLTIISEDDYGELFEKIFYDNGLNIAKVQKSNSIMSSADVIINLRKDDFKSYHILKSGAVYIDLSNNIKSTLNLCIKREDVLVIDNINVAIADEVHKLDEFEMAYYNNSTAYKRLKNSSLKDAEVKKIKRELIELNADINSFIRLDKTLNSTYYMSLRQKINKC